MSSVHSAAQQGFSAEAQRYAQGRPEYPEALSDWLRDALGLRPQTVAVDLGAGTGKFTRLLARTGARVVAVEPVDAMRAQLAEALPQVQALAGSAQSIPLANGFADALVCAQAFHWFATVEALEEMRRVLTAEGRLGLVWNVRDESLDWVAEITRIITPTKAMRRVSTRATGVGRSSARPSDRCDFPPSPTSMSVRRSR